MGPPGLLLGCDASPGIRAGRGLDLSVPGPLLYREEAEVGRSGACLRSHSPPGMGRKWPSSPTSPRPIVCRGRGPLNSHDLVKKVVKKGRGGCEDPAPGSSGG